MSDETGTLQIYPQHSWHSAAEIIGCPVGLAALRDALTTAIEAGKAECLVRPSDGEGYHLKVRRMPSWPGDNYGKDWDAHSPYYEQLVQWEIEGQRDEAQRQVSEHEATIARLTRERDEAGTRSKAWAKKARQQCQRAEAAEAERDRLLRWQREAVPQLRIADLYSEHPGRRRDIDRLIAEAEGKEGPLVPCDMAEFAPDDEGKGGVMGRTLCPSCLRDVPADWPHSCFRACRGCKRPIEPQADYCGECEPTTQP